MPLVRAPNLPVGKSRPPSAGNRALIPIIFFKAQGLKKSRAKGARGLGQSPMLLS